MKATLSLLLVLLCAPFIIANVQLTGVNEAGADFAPGNNNYGSSYEYPNPASYMHLQSLGMNIFRVPFLWERLQTSLGATFDSTEQGRLVFTINNITNGGAYALLDPHNYARYPSGGGLIGSSGGPTNDQFKAFWQQLAGLFVSNPRVIFGLMNEPNGLPTEQWLAAANAGIAGIRAAGATQLIFVPGNGYTGAHSWTESWYGTPNSQVMTGVVDSGNNFAFEVHQYFDSDYSGTSSTCQSGTAGSAVMPPLTSWAQQHGYKVFVGEFGAANNPTCQACVQDFLNYLNSYSSIYIGWTWWAAGPLWGSYMYSIEPNGNQDQPQTAWLVPYLAGAASTNITGTGNSLQPSPAAASSIAPGVSASPINSGSDLAVYTDSMQGQWSAGYSWATNYALTYTGPYTYPSGSGDSISWGPNGYTALYFTCTSSGGPACFDNSFSISFWVNGGSNGGGQTLRVLLRDGTLTQVGNQQLITSQTGTWTQAVIPIASFGASGPYAGFTIQDNGGNSGNTLYIDQIYILASSSAASSPATQASQSGQPGQTSQASKTSSPATQASQSSQPGQTSQASQSGQPGQTSQASQSSQPGQVGQSSQPSQSSQPGQAGQTSQPSQTSQPGSSPYTQAIYLDQLQNNWQITQQPGQFSQVATNPTYSNSQYSISYAPSGNDRLVFSCYNQQCMNSNQYYGLYFEVNSGSSSGQQYSIQITQNGNLVGNAVTLTASSGWQTVQIAFSQFGSPSGRLDGFVITGALSTSQPSIYFDNIYVLVYSGSLQIVYPSSNKRDSTDPNVAANTATATNVPSDQASSPSDNTVNLVGLNSAQIDYISDPSQWLTVYNELAGTSYTSDQIKVSTLSAPQSDYSSSGSRATCDFINYFISL